MILKNVCTHNKINHGSLTNVMKYEQRHIFVWNNIRTSKERIHGVHQTFQYCDRPNSYCRRNSTMSLSEIFTVGLDVTDIFEFAFQI